MTLRLTGHDYRYAAEQIMLAMFPEEKITHVDTGPPKHDCSGDLYGEPSAESTLSFGKTYAHAAAVLRIDGGIYRGAARVKRDRLINKLERDRLLQKAVKQSFYRAAVKLRETPPVWGSLTGIRPAKLAASALESGMSGKSAAKFLTREYYVSPERAGLCVDAARHALAVKAALHERDIALYVGIPFCPTRCAYCSFVSNSVEKSFGLIEPFTETLLGEISAAAAAVRALGLRVISVYIGGGTPTALPAERLEAVMLALGAAFDFTHVREYTVEAGRPDTITPEKLDIMRRCGATRYSVNPQSMSGAVLEAIGRRHTPQDVLDAVRLVRQSCGTGPFRAALNMDIIAGLPGDTPEGFRSTLDTILSLEPENITVHTLSLKKGSRIMLEGTAIPGGPEVGEMLGHSSRRLRERGYAPYYLYRQKFTSGGFENTGWSMDGFEGIYNICMMEDLCTVLSLGGGGVTKLVSGSGRIERIFNAKYPREYILQAGHITNKMDRIKEFYYTEG